VAFETEIAVARRRALAMPDSLRRRLLLLAWDQPPIAIGSGSFQSEILTLAGATNVFADLPVPSAPVSIEAIVARNPDFVLVSDSGIPAFAHRPEWAVVEAVRERRFIHLRTSAFGRPSPRAPAVVLELAARLTGAIR
jgi:ABC-type Fe3+-hydroxamate transport system substrate-binding protein